MAEKFILSELCRYPLGTFAEIIYRNALFQPDDEAFVIGSRRETFSSFNARVNRLIHGLNDSGCVKGDVLGILSWNCLEYMEVWGAAMKGGFILAHLSPRLSGNEILDMIAHTGARAIFCGPEFAEYADRFKINVQGLEHCFVFGADSKSSYQKLFEGKSEEEIDIDLTPEDPVTIFFTSGTTGTPKGAVYSHRKKIDNSIGKALDIGVHNGDRNFIVLPMFHVGGDSHIWPFFIRGCCNVIMEKTSFDPASMLKTIQDEKITDVQIVPTQLVALLNHPRIDQYDLSSLKRIWYAASPMPTEVLKRGINMFGPIFMQGYGLSESGPHTTWLPKEAHLEKGEKVLASCGRPCSGVHMRVVDINDNDVPPGEMGEIIVNSSRVMSGYWGQQEEDSGKGLKNGWLYTGDVGYYDEHGYIYIADRKNDMIVTGGENVYPKEVEEILYQHPSVYEAAVIGVPDSYWVERVHAMVVLREGEQATEEDIVSFCKERIARFKTPKSVDFIEELPKSPQGKVLKRELRKHYSKSS